MIVSFLYNSGARIDELAKAKAKDLTYRSDGSTLVKLHGKGGRIRRVVLNLAFSKRLRAFVQGIPESASLFCGQRGALTHSGLRKVIKGIVNRAKLNPRISPHWLRHYFANTALNHGAKLHHVSHALGHRSLQSTTTYTHGTLSTSEAPSSFLAKTKEIFEEKALLPM